MAKAYVCPPTFHIGGSLPLLALPLSTPLFYSSRVMVGHGWPFYIEYTADVLVGMCCRKVWLYYHSMVSVLTNARQPCVATSVW